MQVFTTMDVVEEEGIEEAVSLLLLGERRGVERATRRKKARRKKRKQRGQGGGAQEPAGASTEELDIVEMNRVVEDVLNLESRDLPPALWDEWLWRSNPNDLPSADALLNRCHLLALLICR